MWVKMQQLELDIKQRTSAQLGKEHHRAIYCHLAYLTYTQSRFSSVQSLSHIRLYATPWTARQAPLCITNSQCLRKLISVESVMPSNHLMLCLPLLLPPSVFPSIRVFSDESVVHIRWPKYWSFSFSISPSRVHHVNTGLNEVQAGIEIASRNINNLRYADDSIIMAESEEN